MMNKNKYSAKRTRVDNITFDSKVESERYSELKLLERAGQISKLVVQPEFEIIPKQKDERPAKYRADFMYLEKGKIIVEDVKSEITRIKPDYVLRKKLFKLNYPDIIFREIIL